MGKESFDNTMVARLLSSAKQRAGQLILQTISRVLVR